MSEELVDHPTPDVLAMIVADTILRDLAGKSFIQGTFNVIFAGDFPHTHPHIAVFVALTDGRGKTPISIRLIDAAEERKPVFEVQTEVNFEDPIAVIEIGLGVPAATFPEAGEYRLQLFAANQLLKERRLIAATVSPEPEAPSSKG